MVGNDDDDDVDNNIHEDGDNVDSIDDGNEEVHGMVMVAVVV